MEGKQAPMNEKKRCVLSWVFDGAKFKKCFNVVVYVRKN